MDNIKEYFFRDINIIDEIKKIDLKKLITYISIIISFYIIPFILNDLVQFSFSSKLFDTFWIVLFIIIIYIARHKRLIYLLLYYLFLIFSLVQYFHINIVKTPFSVSQLAYFKEGATYTNSIVSNINITVILYLLFIILNSIICSKLIKKYLNKKNKFQIIKNITLIIIFVPLLIGTRFTLLSRLDNGNNDKIKFFGEVSDQEIYDDFSDKKRAFNLTGIFEYSFRDPYLYMKKTISFDVITSKEIVDNYFKQKDILPLQNDYTGIFKDKNVIFIIAESIDTWLIEEDIMPTVYNMKNNSIDFTNRYAPTYGSGRTLNTEYCLNTGLYIPLDYNIYSAKNNNYDYSLPNMFKNNGYMTSSIHFNNGSFYDRVSMHKSYGYDNAYFLADMTGKYYYNDADIISNDEFYNLMVSKDNKFLTYFTTYSVHLPYDNTNELCKDISTEEECIKTLAKYTDDAIKILIEKLQRDNLIDDTVIVFITDHYAYGYSEDKIEKLKGGTTNIELDKVPFFIWNNNQYVDVVDSYIDTQDILPTVFNLFGIKYNNKYIGTDVFSNNHNDYVYFSDKSYVGNTKNISITNIENEQNINDLIVKIDYYK